MTRWPCCGNVSIKLPGYEDTNDADRLFHDPLLQIVADEKLGDAPLGRSPRSAVGKTVPAPAIWRASVTLGASSSSVSAATMSASAGRSCSISTPPTIPPTANNNSAFSTVPTASTCIIPYSSSSATRDAWLAARLRPGNASNHAIRRALCQISGVPLVINSNHEIGETKVLQ